MAMARVLVLMKAAAGLHWVEFVESFGDQSIWDLVCLENYAPFFEQAVGIVDEVCDAFIPPK